MRVNTILILSAFLVTASCSGTRKAVVSDHETDLKMRQQMAFHEASMQSASGNYDAALDLFRHSLALDSCSAASMYSIAELYMTMGDRRTQQAFAPIVDSLLSNAVRLQPDNYWYRHLYAANLQRMGLDSLATCQYEELSRRFPGNSSLLLTLAAMYDKTGDFEKELRVLTRYGEIEDVADELRMQRVTCYLEMGKLDSAFLETDDPSRLLDILTTTAQQMIEGMESEMDRMRCRSMIGLVADFSDVSLKYEPGLMQAWKSKITTQVWLGDRDRAMETLETGLGQVSDSLGKSALFNLRAEFHHLWGGDVNKVYEDYDSVLAYNPADVMALNNYAYYLSLDGRELERALEMSALTIKAEPLNATYLDTYAWILFRQGKYTQARQYLEKALQYLDTESADIYEHYGDVLFKCGDREGALENWHRAKQLNSESVVLDLKIKEENYIEQE